jgi:hypothetical protein
VRVSLVHLERASGRICSRVVHAINTLSGIDEFFRAIGVPVKNPDERPAFNPAELGKKQSEMAPKVGLTKVGEAKYRTHANGY